MGALEGQFQAPVKGMPPVSEVRLRNPKVERIQSERTALDSTLWLDELRAQSHGKPVIELWDALRSVSENPVETAELLKTFALENLIFRSESSAKKKGPYQIRNFGGEKTVWKNMEWRRFIEDLEKKGFQLVQSEWHQVEFRAKPLNGGGMVEESDFGFVLHNEAPRRKRRGI
jgi:hypothetical protein